MEILVIVGYVSISLAAGLVWIWSSITISQYVKKDVSVAAAFTWFWIFNPSWFTKDGQSVFQKERKRFVGTMALLGIILFIPFYLPK